MDGQAEKSANPGRRRPSGRDPNRRVRANLMANLQTAYGIVPSVLDRLFDDEPRSTREQLRHHDVDDLKRAVARDLADLLNARQTIVEVAPNSDLAESIFLYGLPDITRVNPRSTDDMAWLRREVEQCIRKHEPRLGRVQVEIDSSSQPHSVLFHIFAYLLVEPRPVPIELSTRLETSAGKFDVEA